LTVSNKLNLNTTVWKALDSGVVYCYFKPLTITCCRQQWPREATTSFTFYGFRWRQQYEFL